MGEQPDLRSSIQALWRRRWLFLSIAVTTPVAVFVISSLIPKTYEASTVIGLKTSSVDATLFAAPTSFGASAIDTAARLVNTDAVTKVVGNRLRAAESGRCPLPSIDAEPITSSTGVATDLLTLTAQAGTAACAAAGANAYAHAIDDVRTKEALHDIDRATAKLEAQSATITDPTTQAQFAQQIQQLRTIRSVQDSSTKVLQPATPPTYAVSPHPKRNTALAGVVALLLALGAVAVAERLDRRLRDPADLEALLEAPLLSVIPRAAFPGQRPAPGPVAEAFRTLAASLVYFNVDRQVRTVMVASPTKGDGKTTVATYLAIALARDGQDVVLVDADLRRPQVAVRLGIEPSGGLAAVLTNQADLYDSLVEVNVGDAPLRVLAGGKPPPNPARLLGSARLDSLLVELSALADVVVVDTPPILNVSDAVPLLERVSGVVVVAKVGATGRDELTRMRQVIKRARGDLLGAVATGGRGVGLYGYGDYDTDDGIELPEPREGATGAAAEVAPEKTDGGSVTEEKAAEPSVAAAAQKPAASPKPVEEPKATGNEQTRSGWLPGRATPPAPTNSEKEASAPSISAGASPSSAIPPRTQPVPWTPGVKRPEPPPWVPPSRRGADERPRFGEPGIRKTTPEDRAQANEPDDNRGNRPH